jgi:hypothetical protein
MSIFKGQGKSGVTAPTTRRTVEKNFNKSGVNSKMTTRNASGLQRTAQAVGAGHG